MPRRARPAPLSGIPVTFRAEGGGGAFHAKPSWRAVRCAQPRGESRARAPRQGACPGPFIQAVARAHTTPLSSNAVVERFARIGTDKRALLPLPGPRRCARTEPGKEELAAWARARRRDSGFVCSTEPHGRSVERARETHTCASPAFSVGLGQRSGAGVSHARALPGGLASASSYRPRPWQGRGSGRRESPGAASQPGGAGAEVSCRRPALLR